MFLLTFYPFAGAKGSSEGPSQATRSERVKKKTKKLDVFRTQIRVSGNWCAWARPEVGVSSRRNDRLFQNMWFRVGGSLFFHMAAASGGQGCPQPCHRPAQGQAYRGDPQVRAKCRKALSFLCFLVQSHRKPRVFKHFACRRCQGLFAGPVASYTIRASKKEDGNI